MTLFDNPKKIREKAKRYFGKIGCIDVRIDFSMTSSCSLNAKTQEDLNITYRKILNSLIKN